MSAPFKYDSKKMVRRKRHIKQSELMAASSKEYSVIEKKDNIPEGEFQFSSIVG